MPPQPVNNADVMQVHRAEKVARARINRQETRLASEAIYMMTRNAAAILRNEDDGNDCNVWLQFDSDTESRANYSNSDSDYEDKPSSPSDRGASSGCAETEKENGRDGKEVGISANEENANADDSSPGSRDERSNDTEDSVSFPQNVTSSLHGFYNHRVKRGAVWFSRFMSRFKTWDQFHDAFHAFQSETYQRVSTRSTTSVPKRSKQVVTSNKTRKRKPWKDVKLIPEEDWNIYSKTLVCTNGQPHDPKGKGKRNQNRVRGTKCMTRVNVRVIMILSGSWHLCVNASGDHNHTLNKHPLESYAENCTVKDVELTHDVAILHTAGAHMQGILRYHWERTGWLFKFGADLVSVLRYVHNMVQRHKTAMEYGLNDAQRAFAVLDEFSRQNEGNAAQVLMDP
ncbi:LOW QUALITY PROTEIN: hypothetical protein PHMEG_00012934 [Phytophthora megakarya]|uniref:ABC transporter n=1 Tax=Phytophthora megakarya TaxID=4795 RepID=A0A225W802_9STRA|nr:LOW QUALITY PROTEIN: hypothetical protein PHMEG_00012934 [Phytophthora megakarya]